MITKRTFLRGLFAAPAIVAASSLMPIRGELLILPEELNTAQIVAILERRIDAANHQMQMAMSRAIYGVVHGPTRGRGIDPGLYTYKSVAVPLTFSHALTHV